MTRMLLLRGTLLLLVSGVVAQEGPQTVGWQQGVHYQVRAELDTTEHRLNGSLRVFYQNNSPDTLREVFLQVPSNAFHDQENTAFREMQRFTSKNVEFEIARGYELTIQSVQFLAIAGRSEFPLRAYDFSDTILNLPLPFSLLPGDTLSLGVSFYQDFTREPSGHLKSSVPRDFVHWFPRVAVYDTDGWQAEPFHFMMQPVDVYSEFADMDVTLTVPGNYIVVASAELLEGDPDWQTVTADTGLNHDDFEAWHKEVRKWLLEKGDRDGPRTLRYRASRMHDFIWSASPRFVHYEMEAGLPVHLFYSGLHGRQWLRSISPRVDGVLAYLADHFGPNPYPHLSLVQGANRSLAYPMMALLQAEDYFELAYGLSAIYFPGLVGTNGAKEPWLANGLQVYMGKSFSEKKYGRRGYDYNEAREEMSWIERQYPLPTLDQAVRTFTRLYSESGQNEPISKEIHEFHDPIGALFNVYLKSEVFYELLKFVVGDSSFKAGLQETTRRYAHAHINEADLQRVFEQVHGQDLDWFFEQWLRDTPTVDYSKKKVRKYRRGDGTWVTEVEIERNGDGIMPVEVEVEGGKGEKLVKRWDGKAKAGKVVFETSKKPKKVAVDPDDRIMDSNRLNHSKPRLEFRPDLPFLRFVHIPNDAILVLWRPLVGYNEHDSVRLGFGARSSYNAFYNNLTVEGMVGVASGEVDARVAYSHPLSRKSLMNRYRLMVRKNEGRFEADAHIELNGSKGILSTKTARSLRLGLNYSSLLNEAYTFRKVSNDTGKVRFEEWDDSDILLAYGEVRTQYRFGALETRGRVRLETALPGGEAQFTKLSGRLVLEGSKLGVTARVRGNLATSFGPDRLTLQDQFRGEGAGARERFQNDLVKTGGALGAFSRRYVEGGGLLRGYAGSPLPAERFATVNFEVGPGQTFTIFRLFGFCDSGRIWTTRGANSFTRSDAGFGLKTAGDGVNLFGGNLSLLTGLSARLFFPLWLSDPPPGEKRTQFRWYFSLGKRL
ncbi:MAG: M1 family aminopeptidase [bacterium]